MLPRASIVVDKFHVLRLANAALETIRKEHRSRLTRAQRRRLMHDRFLLLKRRQDLTAQEQWLLDSWTAWSQRPLRRMRRRSASTPSGICPIGRGTLAWCRRGERRKTRLPRRGGK